MVKILIYSDGSQSVAEIWQDERLAKSCKGSAEFVEDTAKDWAKQNKAEIIRK